MSFASYAANERYIHNATLFPPSPISSFVSEFFHGLLCSCFGAFHPPLLMAMLSSMFLMPFLSCSVMFSCISVCDSACVSVVHAAGAKVKDLENEADRLLEKLKPIQELQDNLKKNISQIKELINQARKQANSVSAEDIAIQTYLFNVQIYVLEM